MAMVTSRARVRGLGSAKSGAEHWWQHRLSAIGMAVLAPLFFVPFARALGQDYETVVAIYAHPFNAIVAALFLLVAFQHIKMGLQVVVEDYLHAPKLRYGALIAIKVLGTGLGFAGAFAVAMIAFS